MPKMKWVMTDNEIRRSWRCAQNQKEQIKVLAELNVRKKAEVLAKLIELGIELPEKLNRKGLPPILTDADKRKIWKLRTDGHPYKTISNLIEGHPAVETVRTAYKQMVLEREEARPLLVKALQTFMKSEACTEKERKTIREQIARGI